MKNYNCRSYLKRVLVKGTVCYKDGSPIKNAIVFFEAFFPYKHYGLPVKYYKNFCGYTITNCNGEFYCLIHDIRYYYKIKIFKNKYNNISNVSCSIHLD